jgi:hypothetical protein
MRRKLVRRQIDGSNDLVAPEIRVDIRGGPGQAVKFD